MLWQVENLPYLNRVNLINLYQVPTGIVEDSSSCHSHIGWLHRKLDAKVAHAFILLLDVTDQEGCKGYPILNQSFLERFHGRIIGARFKEQLCSFRLLR